MKVSAKLVGITQPVIEIPAASPEGLVAYCMSPKHKVLRDDLTWVNCGDVSVGDVILGFDEKGPNRKYRKAVIESHKIEFQTTKKVTLRSGKVFIVTPEHLWLISQLKTDGSPWKSAWVKTDNLKPGNAIPKLFDVWEDSFCWDFGYLSGLYDGEGWLTKDRCRIGLAQKEGGVTDKLKTLLTQYGFPYTEYRRADGCLNIGIQGFIKDRLKFLGQIRPGRLLEKVNFDLLGPMYSRHEFDFIESVEDSSVQDIVVMKTSTGTLVLDGYPHHNCARVSNPSNQLNPDVDKLLAYCIRNKHWSIFEMVNAVVEVKAPRDITRQLLRHRSFSFQEFSQRYSDEIEFTERDIRSQDSKNRQNSIDDVPDKWKNYWDATLKDFIKVVGDKYKSWREIGVAKECIRVILPEGLTMSTLYVNGTLRSYLTYLQVRLDETTQLEHRLLAKEIRDCLKPVFPVVFKSLPENFLGDIDG